MTLRYMPDAGRLYGPTARDPQAIYAELRGRHRAVAPVEIAPGINARLVIGYRAAWTCSPTPAASEATPAPGRRGSRSAPPSPVRSAGYVTSAP